MCTQLRAIPSLLVHMLLAHMCTQLRAIPSLLVHMLLALCLFSCGVQTERACVQVCMGCTRSRQQPAPQNSPQAMD
jgi:hypothetical protein